MPRGRPSSPRARWQSGVGGLALLAAQQSCAGVAPTETEQSTGHNQSLAGSGGSAGTVAGAAGTNAGGANAGGTNAAGTNAGGMNVGGVSSGGMNAGGVSSGGMNAGGMNGGGTSTAGSSAASGSAIAAALQAACADYLTIVTTDCAHLGCHAGPNAPSQLDLSPDTGLPSRVKDVPAKHLNITCSPPGADIVECTSIPAACPSNALLVDSSNWQASWIIAKLRGTGTGCGDTMPDAEYLTEKQDRELCVERLVQAIAALPK